MNFELGNIRNLHYGMIHSNQSNLINYSNLPFINKNKIPKKYTLIRNGDLILADTSENRNDAAKGVEIINDSNSDIISGLHTIHLREKQAKTINGFKAYYVASKVFRNFARTYCEGIKVFSIKLSLLKYARFAYPQDLKEQGLIVDFLKKIDYKKELLERKINTLKKYKEGLDILAYNFVKKHGNPIRFCNLFANKVEKNVNNIQQFTVGKQGIKKLEKINYDISKHKLFKKDDLIIGIGIEEIAISNDFEGAVSPVYDVFRVIEKKYMNCLKITLKRQLWINRNLVSRKSTRREFEVDKKELINVELFVLDNNMFLGIYESIIKTKKVIDILTKKINDIKAAKQYFQNKMFI